MTSDSPEIDEPEPVQSADELLGEVAHELTVLIRSDFELAATQRAPEFKQIAAEAAAAGAAVAAALLAFAAVSWAAVLGLSHVMASWGAALVVAGTWTLVTVVLLRIGHVARLRERLGPEGQEQAVAAATTTRAEAEQAMKVAAGRLARALMRDTAKHEIESIVAAEHRIADTVERDVEAILRDLVSVLAMPDKAGAFLGRLTGRRRP